MTNKSKPCSTNCCCHSNHLDLTRVKTDAQQLIKQAKTKFNNLKPEQKQKLKQNAAIGGAIALGLFGLKKIFGNKKR